MMIYSLKTKFLLSQKVLSHEKSIDIHSLDSFFELKVLREVIETKQTKNTPITFFYYIIQAKNII
jgi:hypothetical protein